MLGLYPLLSLVAVLIFQGEALSDEELLAKKEGGGHHGGHHHGGHHHEGHHHGGHVHHHWHHPHHNAWWHHDKHPGWHHHHYHHWHAHHHPWHNWYWYGANDGTWGNYPGYFYDPNYYYYANGNPSIEYEFDEPQPIQPLVPSRVVTPSSREYNDEYQYRKDELEEIENPALSDDDDEDEDEEDKKNDNTRSKVLQGIENKFKGMRSSQPPKRSQ